VGTERRAARQPRDGEIRDRAAGCTRSTGGSDTQSGLDASIDYLRVTFRPAADAMETAKRMFGGASWRRTNSGVGGMYYGKKIVCGDLAIHYGEDGGGVTVEARGKGCRQIERQRSITGEGGWQAFLQELTDAGASFARIDFALDERHGVLSLAAMEENVRAGWCASRFRKARATDWIIVKSGEVAGTELAFGRRFSEVVVRMYDKGAQVSAEANLAPDQRESWVRVEIEAKDGKANDFAAAFVAGGFRAILSDLRARITFREPRGTDTNKSRWPVCDWWEQFLGSTPRALIVGPPPSATLEDKAQQIERQWGPTLVAIAAAPHLSADWFDRAVARNQTRLREQHIDLLASSCEQHQARRLATTAASVRV
jgi:phage replication initiation protein